MIKAIKIVIVLMIGGALYTNVCYMRKSSELSSISEVGVVSKVVKLRFYDFVYSPSKNGLVAIYKDEDNLSYDIPTEINDTDSSKYIKKYKKKKLYIIFNNDDKRIGIFEFW